MNSIFSRILVGVDDSPAAQDAIGLAARLAREHDGRLVLCNSVDWVSLASQMAAGGSVAFDMSPMIDDLNRDAETLLARASETARGLGVEPERRVLEGRAAEAILEFAFEAGCSAIVMGTHGRTGWHRFLIGSTTEAVLRGSTIPVLTVRSGNKIAPPPRRCFERIVVGLDDSQPSDAAREIVCAFAPEDCRNIQFYSVAAEAAVVGGRKYYQAVRDELHEQAERVVDKAVALASAHGLTAEAHVVDGHADEALIAAAEHENADLIVVGSHGRRGVARFALGSVAENVVRRAAVPVLVVRTVLGAGKPLFTRESPGTAARR